MAQLLSPCKGCELRDVYCHSTCESYLTWKQDKQANDDKIKTERDKFYATFNPKLHRKYR